MFKFLKKNKKPESEPSQPEQDQQTDATTEETIDSTEAPQVTEKQPEHSPEKNTSIESSAATPDTTEEQKDQKKAPPLHKKKKWFGRLREGLSKTRNQFSDKLGALVLGKKTIDDELLEELEMVLITADVGVDTSEQILQNLAKQVKRKELSNPEMLIKALKQQLYDLLAPLSQPLEVTHKPFVILMVGVNGAGKTTSIAKLAHYYQQQGKTLLLAAGDTFRAAAIEQLQTWGERNNVPVIAQQPGADSASVIYDAVQSTQAKQQDLLIADTAGRLHTQHNLMEELKKIKRVMSKLDENAPHETLLVIDASLGQNSLNQAKAFHEAIGVTGLCITKLDGSAKGGIIFAIARELALPIRFIGVGEGMDDLQPFDAQTFVDALWEDT